MMRTNSRAVQGGLKYINETYGFLLERGYQVVSAEDIPVGWQVVLRKPDLVVRIERSRGEEEIFFRTSSQPPDEFFRYWKRSIRSYRRKNSPFFLWWSLKGASEVSRQD